MRSLAPLDKETIYASVKKTGRAIVVDEAHKTGSAASEIAACLAEDLFGSLHAPVKRVCSVDTPVPFSPPMENFVIPNTNQIVAAVQEVLEPVAR